MPSVVAGGRKILGGWQLHQYINKLHFHMAVPVAEAMAPRKQSGFNSPTVAYGVIAPTGESDCLASSRLWVRVPLAPPLYADVAPSGRAPAVEAGG